MKWRSNCLFFDNNNNKNCTEAYTSFTHPSPTHIVCALCFVGYFIVITFLTNPSSDFIHHPLSCDSQTVWTVPRTLCYPTKVLGTGWWVVRWLSRYQAAPSTQGSEENWGTQAFFWKFTEKTGVSIGTCNIERNFSRLWSCEPCAIIAPILPTLAFFWVFISMLITLFYVLYLINWEIENPVTSDQVSQV